MQQTPPSLSPQGVPFVAEEYATAELGNISRTRRLCWLAELMSRSPDKSFPDIVDDEAGLEAVYRFLRNSAFDYHALMEPHTIQTAERAARVGRVFVLHDTSQAAFSGDRQGLGRLHGTKDKGLLMHPSLVVAGDGSQRPLGVVALQCWARTDPPRARHNGKRKLSGVDYAKLKDKESQRWAKGVKEARDRLGPEIEAIHVGDRETDSYALMAELCKEEDRFIFRVAHDRVVGAEVAVGDCDRMSAALEVAPIVAERQVAVSGRGEHTAPHSRKLYAPREQRLAQLEISAMAVVVRRPGYLGPEYPQWLPLNVVHVREVQAPEGVQPVEWKLLTTESIQSVPEVLAIVDGYRTRWLIEEYFKALKTGCALEERQLEKYETLTKAIAVMVPIAWQLLLLRNLSRTEPEAPATVVLSETQLEVLRLFSKAPLDAIPTVRQALLAVAALGGHLKRNGEPGWLVLGRGLQRLLILEEGWSAAVSRMGEKT